MEKNNSDTLGTAKLIIQVVMVFVILKFLKGLFGKDEGRKEQEEKAALARLEIYSKVKPSFSDIQYFNWARTLDNAILGGLSEDEQAVYSIFGKFKNVSDLLKVDEAFGTQRLPRTAQYVTLSEAIQHYFSPDEIKVLNAILKKKKIDYQF